MQAASPSLNAWPQASSPLHFEDAGYLQQCSLLALAAAAAAAAAGYGGAAAVADGAAADGWNCVRLARGRELKECVQCFLGWEYQSVERAWWMGVGRT